MKEIVIAKPASYRRRLVERKAIVLMDRGCQASTVGQTLLSGARQECLPQARPWIIGWVISAITFPAISVGIIVIIVVGRWKWAHLISITRSRRNEAAASPFITWRLFVRSVARPKGGSIISNTESW